MSKENEHSFRVVDRRPFNPDGTLRPEFAEPTAPGTASESPTTTAPSSPTGSPTRASAPEPRPTSPLFLDFLLGLVSSAAVHLGMVETPDENRPKIDLAAAKQMIDVLGVLREKTSGNLSPEEQQVFDRSLTELRVRYVQVAGGRKERA